MRYYFCQNVLNEDTNLTRIKMLFVEMLTSFHDVFNLMYNI